MGDDWCGDAGIRLLYDTSAEVKITSPPKEIKIVHGIRPKRFLFIPRTKGNVLDGIYLGLDGSYLGNDGIPKQFKWRPVKPKNDEMREHTLLAIGDVRVGGTYPITLIYPILSVIHQFGKGFGRGVPRDSAGTENELTFEPNELEKIIKGAKKFFAKEMKEDGLTLDTNQIYAELFGRAMLR